MNLIKANIRLHNGIDSVYAHEAIQEFSSIFEGFRDEILGGIVSVALETESYFAKNIQYCKDGTLLRSEVLVVTFRYIELLKVEEIIRTFLDRLNIPETFLFFYSTEVHTIDLLR